MALPLFLTKLSQSTNLPSIILLTLLCSFFYFLSLWQHGGGTVSVTTSTWDCRKAINHSKPDPMPEPLDFTAHHSALIEGSIFTPLTKRFSSACEAKFSDYTPCEDTKRSLKFRRQKLQYRERHCPERHERLKCRIPAPYGYKNPFRWPESRDYAWYDNVPHKALTVEKAVQNWIRFEGDRFRFPGGGTMFPHGAGVYIDDIGRLINLKDGSIRTAVDTGCGVASWGAYLLSRNILTMSFAPVDSHEAQVQFALERGVPAMIGILATRRLPYPSRAFDMAHCSRCLIDWASYEGQYLIEVDRILRPGGYWILSGPPVNWKSHWKGWKRSKEDLQAAQERIEALAKSLCWKKLVEKGDLAIWQKPTNHIHCKATKRVIENPPFCKAQDPDKAWYTDLETCITPLPAVSDIKETAGGPLAKWPERLVTTPPRILTKTIEGVTGETFYQDTQLWKKRIAYYKSINDQLGQKGRYRNVLDMNAYLGGFAAALAQEPLWVMNVVPVEAKLNTLGVIYERGLIGTYQSWCEAMSTYPRTYDFIHADSVFSLYDGRCEMEDILLEMDRILRPEGAVIFRDDVDVLFKIKSITDGMRWSSRIVDHEDSPHYREKLLFAVKSYWTAPASSPAVQ